MKVRPFFLLLTILIVLSCNRKQKNNLNQHVISNDSLVPPKVTLIADLPDSLQPKTVYLNKMNPPEVVAVSKYPKIIHSSGGIYNFTQFTTDDGLASDAITCSMMDKAGNLWFGSLDGGVSKYNGKSLSAGQAGFTNFTTAQGLISNMVLSILEDRYGNIWICTQNGGLSKYDGQSFTNFTAARGLANNNAWSIIEDRKGNLWIGCFGGGISKYDPENQTAGQSVFTNFSTANGLLSNRVTGIVEDRDGVLWIGTAEGLCKYDGRSFTNIPIPGALAGTWIMSLTEDNTGNIWFCTLKGVCRYNRSAPPGEQAGFTVFTTAQGLPSNHVRKITKDNAGNLWFATNKGFSKYDGTLFTNITSEQGLVNNEISNITEDKYGNLWICTLGDGVSKYDGEAFINFTTAKGLPGNLITGITEDKGGNLWLSTPGNGVSKYSSKSLSGGQVGFVNFTTEQGLHGNNIYCVMEDKAGNLWIGTDSGVCKYNGKTFTNFSIAQGLVKNGVYCIYEDNNGILWFGATAGGVARFDGESLTSFTTAQGLADNIVRVIAGDKKGNLWFCTERGGVSKYDGKSFTNFTTAQGLANNYVRNITLDKNGNLWFSTYRGISLMRQGSEKLFRNFKVEDGLPDNDIAKIIQMPDGRMMVGSRSGITFFNVDEDYARLTDIEIFNAQTDYPVKNLNGWSNALYLDSKGIIWAGTRSEKRGLVRFDYAALHRNTTPPGLVIQSIKVKDENICWYNLQTKGERKTKQDSTTALLQEFLAYGKTLSRTENDSILKRFGNIRFDGITPSYPLPENLVLPYEHNQVGFEFAAIETDRPNLVKYQYMLEGYDKNWSVVTNKSSANFGNMSEGRYTFKLKAQGSNKVWTEVITYPFRVLPPWYRSWWAYTVYALLFISGIFLFIRWRTKSLQKEKIVLEEKVTTRTAELKESLENLKATQSQLIQSEKMASLGELTAGIAHEIQNPLNFVNNFSEVSKELIEEVKSERSKKKSERDEGLEEELLDDIAQNLEKINHHGKRADAIVKGMLAHSRTSTGQKEPTDLNALCEEYLRLAWHGLKAKDPSFNASFRFEPDETLPKVNVVPQDIGRVLLNLINNAFQAVAEKKVQQAGDYEPTVTVNTKKVNDRIEVKVKDNGNGIPSKVLGKIFQPFFTTKPTGQGTGLGLSLSYDIIKAHGGELTVQTKEGEETIFIIQLPDNTTL